MIEINIEELKKSHQIVYVCSHVFKNIKPVLYVCKEDGDWQFLCGDYHADDESPNVIGLGHLLQHDVTIAKVMNLECDHEAERKSIQDDWITTKIEHYE